MTFILMCFSSSLTFAVERNPFEPLVTSPDKLSQTASPEQYALGQLSLKAVIWDTEKKLALFQTDDGKTLIVKPGNKIGKKGGILTSIGDNIVFIKEGTKEVKFRLKN
ncbi:MAG: hypothetical protein A2Z91_04145 [Deltaproteobacteria bacterium GWA2_38_16]|nr:MAG: hypothetical protein A2Z91_04145 [Deltaproteobacteria bacterium GWA2_38_16]OGQ01803.1 MAG: hypothetical protein A3D19_08035 [Deltaproteobacteria bacterium RIFCSPHIGHO2_02_FULL_38_15]OGQ30258.1 MAG: hypothetical protein A3A72_08405 [Deltaproteobacteria bacterium RIFCSPLOWO2_01_FULL_38_9]OGQ58903.1 MAG: hypothetical protein A3G92_07855 [Deltaproteobacteria bacterium RIFCSPLOWO2_12_FULL_38_8]